MISCDLVIPVTVAVQGGEHDTERASPLTEEDEEVMSQALLWKQEAPVVHWRVGQVSLSWVSLIEKMKSQQKY